MTSPYREAAARDEGHPPTDDEVVSALRALRAAQEASGIIFDMRLRTDARLRPASEWAAAINAYGGRLLDILERERARADKAEAELARLQGRP